MKFVATKEIEMSPVELVERLLGDDAEEYKEILEEYKNKCNGKTVSMRLILGEDEFSLRTEDYEQ